MKDDQLGLSADSEPNLNDLKSTLKSSGPEVLGPEESSVKTLFSKMTEGPSEGIRFFDLVKI